MYVASCHTHRFRMTSAGTSPSTGTSARTNVVAKNITTLAMMMPFSAVETGPGPNENDEA